MATSSRPATTAGASRTAPECPGFRDVTLRSGDHATQIDRRNRDDRCRTTGPLSRRARGWQPNCPGLPALDHRGRARRWTDHVAGLVEAQIEYAAWLESLPDNLRDSPLAEALQAICDLDLAELEAINPPRGFGRD